MSAVTSLRESFKMFGFVADESYFIVLALGTKKVDGSWKVYTWKVFDDNTRLLAVIPIEEITEIPCKIIYAAEGV
jgi:hypothetical protein